MITTFFAGELLVYAVETEEFLSYEDSRKLEWLLAAPQLEETSLLGSFIGPRREIVSPWSTNATEICANVGIPGIRRIEQFRVAPGDEPAGIDSMLESLYEGLDQETLVISEKPEPIRQVEDIAGFNQEAGLALSEEEIGYLRGISDELGRFLTDSEIYGFAQINSEHCRHKIFNGTFVIDGKEQPKSLFSMIKQTSKKSPHNLVSAYKDNVAFMKGPELCQFAPEAGEKDSYFQISPFKSVLSLKAETHNFPTTVEPFNGASTGGGGEIRDRMAGGIGSIPLAGTAVYMTAYPRLKGSRAEQWERYTKERSWKYQTPAQILIKASNGASDFGNKFGQPLICGSLLTYEGKTPAGFFGFDRTIMLAGGVGYAKEEHALKREISVGDKLVLLGGDNYRIGMAGGSVSSVDTGDYARELELSAVQRANPEMQKRVYNVIRALVEKTENPIRMIHDHGAGGHINCFSELLESKGGRVFLDKLPVGDPTLSMKEIICNESQERMGLIVREQDLELLSELAKRERAPLYVVGEVTGDLRIVFETDSGCSPFALPVPALLGSSPLTVLEDRKREVSFLDLEYSIEDGEALSQALENVLSLEGVACKDWLTNKVDRSVTGLVALQQCAGPLQLPVNNLGVMALDYLGVKGTATSLGHAPVAGIIDERAGSVLSVAEALTNLLWAPLESSLEGVVLSANWMWPAKQPGEDARLYSAVEALSEFCQELGIAVPTGKDSLSMTMKYQDGSSVKAPGTVIVSAQGAVSDVRLCVTPALRPVEGSVLLLIDLSGIEDYPLGGSAFSQTLGQLGELAPTVADASLFKRGFNFIQSLVREEKILAGHDVSSGGLITALCEMAFSGDVGVELRLQGSDSLVVPKLFCEKPGVLLQSSPEALDEIEMKARSLGLNVERIAEVRGSMIKVHAGELSFQAPVAELRRVWFKPSYYLEQKQSAPGAASERFRTFDTHPLRFCFPEGFSGKAADYGLDLLRRKPSGVRAAIVREKGTNGDRELALSLFAAGFDVKDVTMSDLMHRDGVLDDVRFIVFPGGFSNSDVLGAARGWAGVFRYNDRAKKALERFYAREDTLSLGVCNGCQLMFALNLVYPEYPDTPEMQRNESDKFESSFLGVRVKETRSVMLKPLIGTELGIWVAHGEGRFTFPRGEEAYDIALRFVSADYPANPNGSQFNAAGVVSKNGRHLAMMPHLERSIFSWQWAYLPTAMPRFEVSPWALAFIAAREWIEGK